MTKCLIVDDNNANLYLLKSILESEGWEVLEAENGKVALEIVQSQPFDIIVSDILMPVMDGYALCRQCKSNEKLKDIPFVFYTATYTEPKDEKFSLDLGADRFIIKPQEPEVLINILTDLLKEKKTSTLATAKPLGEEMEFFRRHNEALFRKLEKKMSDLEDVNQELRTWEEKYRLILENVTDVLITVDSDLKITSLSPSVEKILGYKPQDFIGRPVSDLAIIIKPEYFEQVMNDTVSILKGETLAEKIYEFVAKDGTIKVGEVSGSPLLHDGKVIGMVSVARDITERKLADEMQRESEKKYRELYNFLPIPVYEMDFEANITSVNRAIYETFKGKEEDFKGGFKGWRLLSSEEVDKSAKNIQRLLKGEQIKGTEYNLTRLDGSVFPAIVISSVIYRDGKPVGLRGAIIDITQRKQSEEALRESEEKYRSLFENLQDAILLTIPEGAILEVNKAGCEMFGRSADEIRAVGRNGLVDVTDPRLQAALKERDQTGGVRAEITMLRANGEKFPVDITSTIFTDMNGQKKTSMIIRDITERKRTEDALRKSDARFRSYFELPLVGIAITSLEKGWLEVNDRLPAILGYSWEELKNITWSEMTYPDDLNADVEKFNSVLAGEIDGYTMDKRFIRKDGEVIWTSMAVGCIRKKDNTVDYFVVVLEDITDRKNSVKKLRESLEATVNAIAVMVESRDPYTAGHQRRVADLARSIAIEMGLTTDQIDAIRMAAVIHDIGKISVPAEILSMPRKLTDIEFGLIKTHAQAGYDILKDIEFPWPIARIVLEHHERMDGSGYPDRLKGDEILLESRIIAVADVMEAMASHRPYRASLGIEPALKEIEKNKGIIYDNAVSDACLRLFREKNYKLTYNNIH